MRIVDLALAKQPPFVEFHKERQQRQVTQESQYLHYFVTMHDRFQGIKIDQNKIEIYQDKQYNADDGDSGYIFHGCDFELLLLDCLRQGRLLPERLTL